MSTKKGTPAQHGGRNARDAGAANGLALAAATSCRLADAWIAAAQSWLAHGASPHDVSRAQEALRQAAREVGEGLRSCEALHGVDPPEAPKVSGCDHSYEDFAGVEVCSLCGQERI